jgi:uncharacterized protein involved in type VI secretion and phage assembly
MKTFPGVVIGIVKSLDDPQGEGRIQLQFPWLEESHRSAWAPVAVPLAGKSRGAFFMPEPEDEVLVAFEHGDFDHPFIIGFLWNGVDRPPESDPQNRIILTPGGHTLRFEDGDNVKKIIIKSSSGHEISLDDTAGGQTISLKTKGNQNLVLDDKDQSIQLQGGGRILALRGGQVQIS